METSRMTQYEDFINSKAYVDSPSGFDATDGMLTRLAPGEGAELFPFQKAITLWALKRGRAAVFADTGLGKTFIQASWAWAVHQSTGNRVIIFAPLCVAMQTVAEADKLGVPIKYVRSMPVDEFGNVETGVFITNYEMLDHFDLEGNWFDGVVLDESSILKHQTSKTRTKLIHACRNIPYRLSCTATPSPNDYMELGNQAEFLGVMGTNQMLSTFFVHDSGDTSKWRLKGHGKTRFWEWMSHWAVFIKKPSNLGFEDTGYDLPPLTINERVVVTGKPVAQTMGERNEARKESIDARVAECAELVNADPGRWVVWCNRNEESSKLAAAIPGAVEVYGSLDIEEKEKRIQSFTSGASRVIVTKASITGFGLNWQHCHKMAFVGLTDSYEDLYQAIRRCYRFGQTKPVEVVLISADSEGAVRENIKRKEAQAEEMSQQMIVHMREFCRREVTEMRRESGEYCPKKDIVIPVWVSSCV